MDPKVSVYRKNVAYYMERSGNSVADTDSTTYRTSLGEMDDADIRARIELVKPRQCQYCSANLVSQLVEFSRGEQTGVGLAIGSMFVNYDRITRQVCPRCGWWSYVDHLSRENSEDFIHESEYREGVLELFDVSAKDIPLEALRLHLSRHPGAASLAHPTAFEKLVESVYRDHFDCEVRHVGGADDDGVDILAIIAEEPVVLQVKRTSSGTLRNGPEIVRALLGATLLQGASHAHLVTSAVRYTKATQETARRAQLISCHQVSIELKSLGDLLAMLGSANDSSEFIRRLGKFANETNSGNS